MEQSSLAYLHTACPSNPPQFTHSEDKFNLEVPRTDKARRQHWGHRGRGGHLIPPPAPFHLLRTCTPPSLSTALHPQASPHKGILLLFLPCFLLLDGWQEAKTMSNNILLNPDALPVELNDTRPHTLAYMVYHIWTCSLKIDQLAKY